jgi:NAD(P)-dependent dehydrogenase (short-subunit alcohol dehydrogenase family)
MSRLSISNKVAIVTGASKGIGGGIATALGAAGARVAVNYSSDREGAERIERRGPLRGCRRRSRWEDAARPARSRHGYRPAGGVSGVRGISLDHRRSHSRRGRSRRRLSALC